MATIHQTGTALISAATKNPAGACRLIVLARETSDFAAIEMALHLRLRRPPFSRRPSNYRKLPPAKLDRNRSESSHKRPGDAALSFTA